MTKICLIRPPTIVAKWAHTSPTCPPIGMAYLASALKKAGYLVQAIDATGEAISQMLPAAKGNHLLAHGLSNEQVVERISERTDYIGISCMFSHEWPQTVDLIEKIRLRFPKIPIVAGGEHVSAVPEYSLESCLALDYCVIGEGEESSVALFRAIKNGVVLDMVGGIAFRQGDKVVRTCAKARIRDIDSICPPDWSIFPLVNYLDYGYGFGVSRGRNMPIIATRGCPYQCTFCSSPTMWTTRWIARETRKVIEEMKSYIRSYQATNFDFYDLTAVVKREWIVEFCKLLIEENLNVTWQLPSGTRSEAIDGEVTTLLYRSGCRNLSYAPESGSDAILHRIKKKIKLPRMMQSMKESIKAGINIKANIILGFPEETHKEIWETLWFVTKTAWLGLHDLSISPFSPYPGSELFFEMQKNGQMKPFTEQYFLDLTSYTDITSTISYSKNVSSQWLAFYRMFGQILFYFVSYLRRPSRLGVLIYHLVIKRHESRLEMSLHDMIIRLTRKLRFAN